MKLIVFKCIEHKTHIHTHKRSRSPHNKTFLNPSLYSTATEIKLYSHIPTLYYRL